MTVKFTSFDVPVSDKSIGSPGINRGLVFRQSEGSDRLVVALDDPQGFRVVVDVQVGDEAAEGNRQKVLPLPQARDLLIVDGRAHDKLGDALAGAHVPDLARFVTGGGQELLAVWTPGNLTIMKDQKSP